MWHTLLWKSSLIIKICSPIFIHYFYSSIIFFSGYWRKDVLFNKWNWNNWLSIYKSVWRPFSMVFLCTRATEVLVESELKDDQIRGLSWFQLVAQFLQRSVLLEERSVSKWINNYCTFYWLKFCSAINLYSWLISTEWYH